MKTKCLKGFFPLGATVFGNILYALTVKVFLLPAELVTGGSTGIALTANHLTDLPVPTVVLFFNLGMLALGWLVLGRAFAFTTIVSTFLYPLALEGWGRLLGDLILTQDLLLCTIFSGIGIGLALGIVIRAGASTGGMDIPPLVLKKLCHIPVSVSLYVFDACILLSQALFRPAEHVLYGLLLVLIYTVTLDRVLLVGKARTELKIVSRHSEEIRKAVIEQMDRGVTLLEGESGYFRQPIQMIFSVVSNREIPRLERLVREIDPECFIVMNRVSEVRGRGFSMKKYYPQNDAQERMI